MGKIIITVPDDWNVQNLLDRIKSNIPAGAKFKVDND